ncbi:MULTISPECIES: restriction endonuclease subunit S [Aeromonas]|uniref:restriction endonuclease subunit S n=1 Tax=Aeromonas TaxID=642 RepID=UPI0030051B4F
MTFEHHSFGQISLKDSLEFIVDNRGRTAPTATTGIALIATNCVNNRDLYPQKQNLRYVSKETFDTWFRAHPKPGDILLTNKGSQNGAVCLVPNPVDFCIAQDMVALRADSKKIEPLYLFAALRSDLVQARIKALNVDAVIPHFKKTDFDKLFLPLPTPAVQRFVGALYYELSLKIEFLRETNITLESILQTLFKSWFVDFDPVHARARGEQPAGLTPEVASLFPDSFEESELGMVPKGWTVKPVGDAVECIGGGTPDTKKPAFWEPAEHSWTTPKDLSGLQSPVLLQTERKLSSEGLAKVSSGLLPTGTLLMSSRAPIGYLAITQMPVAVNQGYIAMPLGGQLPPLYMLFWCRQNMEMIKSHANGSTFMEISKKAFRPLPALVPSKEVIVEFMRIAEPLFARLVENQKQAQTLATLRDTLLPRLISGQLRLPEAEAMAEGAS